jgi:hypothetical protein
VRAPARFDVLRLVTLLGIVLSLAAAAFFALLASIRSDPYFGEAGEGDALRAASTVAIVAALVALVGLTVRSRAVTAVGAGIQAVATVWIGVAWEQLEGFASGGGDSGSLELVPVLGGILLVDFLAVVWAVTFRAGDRR